MEMYIKSFNVYIGDVGCLVYCLFSVGIWLTFAITRRADINILPAHINHKLVTQYKVFNESL